MTQPLLKPGVSIEGQDRVGALFADIEERLGFVPDGLRLYGISPALLENFMNTVGYFNTESALGPRLVAMIRYLVSYQAKCSFCIDLNEGFLTAMGLDLDAIRGAREDLEAAPVDPTELPLLRVAVKAVSDPERVSAEDVDACRAAGWDDRGIFDAVVAATGNRAFNMLLSAFKVEHQGAFAA